MGVNERKRHLHEPKCQVIAIFDTGITLEGATYSVRFFINAAVKYFFLNVINTADCIQSSHGNVLVNGRPHT
jgi:hypothetical protein